MVRRPPIFLSELISSSPNVSMHFRSPLTPIHGISAPCPKQGLPILPRLVLLALLVSMQPGCEQKQSNDKAVAKASMLREIGLPTDDSIARANDTTRSEAANTNSGGMNSTPGTTAPSSSDATSPETSDSRTNGSIEPTTRIEVNRAKPKADEREDPWLSSDRIPRTQWEIQYEGNQPVGYIRRSVELSRVADPAQNSKENTLRIEAESRVFITRKGQTTEQRTQIISIERPNGELLRLEGTLQNGTNKTRFQGSIRDGNLRFESIGEGRPVGITLPWTDKDRGPFAIEQSLMRSPMTEKEIREVRYFDPLQMRMVDARLEALEFLETPIYDGTTERLLEIQSTSRTGETERRAILWADASGESHKSYLPGIDYRSFRCDPKTARLRIAQADVEGVTIKDVPVFGDTPLIHTSTNVTYRVELRAIDSKLFVSNRTNQTVRAINPRTSEVTVYGSSEVASISQETALPFESEPNADPSTLISTPIISSSNPQIKLLGRLLLEAQGLSVNDSKSAKANAIRDGIAKRLPVIPFDKSVRLAEKVLVAGKGHSVDHSVVLAATLRATQIPARIAIGFLANQSAARPMMAFHAWVEYHDGERWIPIDSSRESSVLKPDRLKFTEVAFDSLNPYDDLLPIIRLASNLEVSVVQASTNP